MGRERRRKTEGRGETERKGRLCVKVGLGKLVMSMSDAPYIRVRLGWIVVAWDGLCIYLGSVWLLERRQLEWTFPIEKAFSGMDRVVLFLDGNGGRCLANRPMNVCLVRTAREEA